jgi:hypothetical protein
MLQLGQHMKSETGQVYTGNKDGYWDRLEPIIKKEV